MNLIGNQGMENLRNALRKNRVIRAAFHSFLDFNSNGLDTIGLETENPC